MLRRRPAAYRVALQDFGSLLAVKDVSLDFRAGEIHAIIGPNGAGKTTFLNLLSGELLPTSGSLLPADQDVTGWTPDRLARAGMGRSFQHSSIFEDLTTFENVAAGRADAAAELVRFFRRPIAMPMSMLPRAWEKLGLAAIGGRSPGRSATEGSVSSRSRC